MTSPARSTDASVVLISRSAELLSAVSEWLADEHTAVRTVHALAALHRSARPDLVIVDRRTLNDAFSEIRRLRRQWPTVEVAALCAVDDEDIAGLLDAGADDAMAASPRVARARLQAMARRARTQNASLRIAVGDIVFDREARRVWCAGVEVSLTPTEHAVLGCLLWHSPATVSATELAEFVWGSSSSSHRALARVYLGYLRAKLKRSRRAEIRTARGHGYQLVPTARGY